MGSWPIPGEPDEFVVHTDRAAIHRRGGGILALHGILTLVVVIVMVWLSSLDLWGSLPLLILLVGQMFQLSYHSFFYGTRVAISQPLIIDHRGFAMGTWAGRMEVPWEAVRGVRIRSRLWNRVLVVELHPAAGPGSPGLLTDIPSRYWARMKRSGGPMLGEKGIRESYDQILQAVGHFSRGRVPIS